ncbi:MAG TPA: class I SAM-dependent methyltransferase [Candidatus Competibacter sp.]|nr:class I SAM-dependent methyltransferase [Candidatus Competibacter sp.]
MNSTTYEAFSTLPQYVEANEKFLGRQPLGHLSRILDLACGNGAVSELLVKAAPQADLNGLDRDPVQIELAIRRFEQLGYRVSRSAQTGARCAAGKPAVAFAVAPADEPPFPEAAFDGVVIANAIHMLPDKEKLVAAAWRVLEPGGLFGFNSAFYAGTFPEGTHQFYVGWLNEAVRHIQTLSDRLQAEGQPPIRRVRDKNRKAFRNRWHSTAEWVALLERQGFQVNDLNERVVMLDGHCFAAIGAYAGFAEVLLNGYPVETAATALQKTAHTALAATGVSAVPRNWLELWAIKK